MLVKELEINYNDHWLLIICREYNQKILNTLIQKYILYKWYKTNEAFTSEHITHAKNACAFTYHIWYAS